MSTANSVTVQELLNDRSWVVRLARSGLDELSRVLDERHGGRRERWLALLPVAAAVSVAVIVMPAMLERGEQAVASAPAQVSEAAARPPSGGRLRPPMFLSAVLEGDSVEELHGAGSRRRFMRLSADTDGGSKLGGRRAIPASERARLTALTKIQTEMELAIGARSHAAPVQGPAEAAVVKRAQENMTAALESEMNRVYQELTGGQELPPGNSRAHLIRVLNTLPHDEVLALSEKLHAGALAAPVTRTERFVHFATVITQRRVQDEIAARLGRARAEALYPLQVVGK